MKTVLWISRHHMTEGQFADLQRIVGDEIIIDQYEDTLRDVSVLSDRIETADVICAVLPTAMLANVKAACGDKPLLQAQSKRIPSGEITLPDGRKEKQFAFVHMHWEQIEELTYKVKIL